MTRRVRPRIERLVRAALPAVLALLIASAGQPAAAQEGNFSRGLLWRIETQDASPSYLLGTMHSADPAVATPSGELRRVLDRVDSVTIELVVDEDTGRKLGRSMLLSDGRRLSDIAGPARFERVVEVGARYGIPAENLDALAPWGVMAIFSLPPAELKRQARGEPALDRVIENSARKRGIPVYGIETAEEQVAAFTDYSEADQLALLDATLESNDRIDAYFDRMLRAYLAGDLAGLHALTVEETRSAPAEVVDRFMERLVLHRNRRMAERIRPRLAEGNALIAVGALHLYGGEGILGLLAAQGYRVSRVE